MALLVVVEVLVMMIRGCNGDNDASGGDGDFINCGR